MQFYTIAVLFVGAIYWAIKSNEWSRNITYWNNNEKCNSWFEKT